jgi:hypothetical protein
MSPPGRPKGEYRRAQPEGTPVNPPDRLEGEDPSAQPQGTPVRVHRTAALPARSQATRPTTREARA